MNDNDDRVKVVQRIQDDFHECGQILIAIGDEVRQSILLELLKNTCEEGMRVGEITACTHLSRPAISHHLKVLKDAGIVYMRKVRTMTFYHINVHAIDLLKKMVLHIDSAVKQYYGDAL